jgi:hypothetical protein
MNGENLFINPYIFIEFKKIEKRKRPYLKLGPYSEISLEIFKKLGHQDLCSARSVCKEWKSLIEQSDDSCPYTSIASPSAKVESVGKEAIPIPVKQDTIEATSGTQQTSSLSYELFKIKHQSPLNAVAYLYAQAKDPRQKRACLSYLLHYQHYNAEFTTDDNARLGYPHPICTPQNLPGYIRTEYNRLFALIEPWIKECMLPSLNKSYNLPKKFNADKYIKLSSSLGIKILKIFSPEIGSLKKFLQAKKAKPQVISLYINPTDLNKPILEILKEQLQSLNIAQENISAKLDSIRKNRKLRFLFLLQESSIDCTLIWEAKWANSKNLDLEILSLKNSITFKELKENVSDQIFTLLNKMGATPDRLAVNAFATHTLQNEAFDTACEKIGIPQAQEVKKFDEKELSSMSGLWKEKIEEIKNYSFKHNPGIELHRKAILQWHSCFFEKYDLSEFASPLLNSQVAPWILENTTIMQWAKGYQNLCEIVMFCLDYYPDEKFIELNLESSLLTTLKKQSQFPDIHASVGLFPYAMSSFFCIFYHLINRNEFNKQPATVACISQNYYEIICLVKDLETKKKISVMPNIQRLDNIPELPDILIADIHPNNAAREKLFQNDVAGWIENSLNDSHLNKKLILILDITLNHLDDTDIQETLDKLYPFIQKGQLEIFIIQSLAKLVQLGADNFSGGTCVRLGKSEMPINFMTSISHKAAYYTLLNEHFQKEIIPEYFTLIRQHADWMYHNLNKRFKEIYQSVWIEEKEGRKSGFCAANVTLNVDSETVYVVINFEPFLKELKNCKVEFIKIQELLLDLAARCKLPLTYRQSFGFSLSSMSPIVEPRIRFSIGIESLSLRERYAELIGDFVDALSRYVAKDPVQFRWDTFAGHIKEVYAILEGEKNFNCKVSLLEKDGDDANEVGEVEIDFKQKLLLTITQNAKSINSPTTLFQEEIYLLQHSWGNLLEPKIWSPSNLRKLFFHLKCLNDNKSVYVLATTTMVKSKKPSVPEKWEQKPCYAIGGFLGERYLFMDKSTIVDEKSGIKFTFEPKFLLIRKEKEFTSDKVYVNVPEHFGTNPARIDKINDISILHEVYTKCVRYHSKAKKYKINFLLLSFTERKENLDYSDIIQANFEDGGLPDVVTFLNNLNPEKLLPTHNISWRYPERPEQRICEVLKGLGADILNLFSSVKDEPPKNEEGIKETADAWHKIEKEVGRIKHQAFKIAILQGIVAGLIECSYSKKKLDREVAKVIASMLHNNGCLIGNCWYEFGDWLKRIGNYSNKTKNISWLTSYLTAFFPFIKAVTLFKIELSVPLYRLGVLLEKEFPLLKEHLEQLEVKILDNIKNIKKERLLAHYLEVYVRYPLREEIRNSLWDELQSLSNVMRSDWISSPNFYDDNMDSMNIEMIGGYDEVIFVKKERDSIQVFFEKTGCKNILLERLKNEKGLILETAFRWAISSQDKDIFLGLLKSCRQSHYEELKELTWYAQFLDKSIDIQKELKNLLNSEERKHEK